MSEPPKLIVLERDAEPNEAMVKMLRDALAMAESGRLIGIVAVGQLTNGDTLTLTAGAYGPFTMLGQLEAAKRSVLEQIE